MVLPLRSLVTLLLLTLTVAPLGAELKITSRVEVQKIHLPDARAWIRIVIVPVHRITPGKVDVTTSVAGDRVRVDGMGPVLGLDRDLVLLSRADGTTIFVLPATRTFFVQESTDVAMLASPLGTSVKTSRKGTSDVLLSQRTERVRHEIRVRTEMPPLQEGLAPDYEGATHDPYGRWITRPGTSLTAEERKDLTLSRSYRSRPSGDRDVIKIESWESRAFGRPALVAARAGASPTAIASAGFSKLANLGFPLRQILSYPSGGHRMETRVTSVVPASFAEGLFDVPAGFTEVAAPPSGPIVK